MKEYNPILGALFSGKGGEGGYNAGFRQSRLAALYQNDDPEKQALAAKQLAYVDPESAGKWQQEQAALRQEGLKRKATMIANAPQEQRGPLYAAVLPDIRKDWAEAPEQYTPELDQMVTAWAQSVSGGANQDGDTRWIQTTDENGKPVWAAANNRGIKPTKFGLPTSYKTVDDEATGKKWRFNIKTGQLEPVDDAYVAPEPQPTIQGADNFKQAFTGLASKHGAQITSITRTPEENRRVGGVDNSYHLTSQAGDFVVPQQNKAQFMADARAMGLEAIDEGDHIHVEPPSRGAPPPRPASGYVGLSAADKARVQAEEKARVDLAYAGPTAAATAEGKARIEAQYGPQIAGATTAAQEEAKRKSQGIADAPKAIDTADQALAVIDKAINHPGRQYATGTTAVLPWDFAAGTAGKDFMAVQKQLEGKAFLQAFESLKGGGQITEMEGIKATQAMARLDRAQSEGEYLQALKELRAIVASAREKAIEKAGGSYVPSSLRAPPAGGQQPTETEAQRRARLMSKY